MQSPDWEGPSRWATTIAFLIPIYLKVSAIVIDKLLNHPGFKPIPQVAVGTGFLTFSTGLLSPLCLPIDWTIPIAPWKIAYFIAAPALVGGGNISLNKDAGL